MSNERYTNVAPAGDASMPFRKPWAIAARHGGALILGLLFGTVFPAHADTITKESVSQYGITWQFNEEHRAGQYVNGDWWVKGPVTINEIQPASTVVDGRVMHGTMVNPGSKQGYDSFEKRAGYHEALNVDPGAKGDSLTVQKGSVVSARSLESVGDNGVLEDLAILTVVEEVPPDDAFRPGPYTESTEAIWLKRDLDGSVMRSLPMIESAPELDSVISSVKRFWNEQNTSWTGRDVHAAYNQPNYGREIAYKLGEALLALQLNYGDAQKKKELFIHMVQRGLDIYGRAKSGGVWKDAGAHNHGRKMPMIFAGLALNDQDIVSMGNAKEHWIFQEDRQTFYVDEKHVGMEMLDERETYREEDIGMPEWGVRATLRESKNDRRWGATYRWAGSGFVYHALAAHLVEGAVEAWNHPPFFDYVDRYVRKGSPAGDGVNAIQPFAQQFWDQYRSIGAGAGEGARPKPPEFEE